MSPLSLSLAMVASLAAGMPAYIPQPSATPPLAHGHDPIAPDLTDPATEMLQIDADRHNRYTVPVTIDGAGPYDFMIDTGSQATAVTEYITSQITLPSLGPATLVGMASRRTVEVVELDRFEVGTRTIHNISAPVLQRQHVGADGIIGLDTLQDFRVLIDFRNETIAIADADDRDSSRGFEIVVQARNRLGQLLITDALIEGVKATVIIDTGAQATLGNLALRDRIRARRAQQVETMDVNGVTMMSELSYARSLSFKGLEMENVPISFADAPAFAALGLQDKPVLSIGMQHLKLFDRVAIDFAKRRIMFDLPANLRRALPNTSASRL
ncbi:MAG: aspartyl protease family protein [Erythrobacter sp.]